MNKQQDFIKSRTIIIPSFYLCREDDYYDDILL